MSRQMWGMFSVALIGLLLFGVHQTTLTADSLAHEFTPACDTIDQQTKDTIKDIGQIFEDDDLRTLTDRVNELVTSTSALEEEVRALEVAICLDEVYEDTILSANINGYHSLLLYALETDKKNLQFEEITFTMDVVGDYLEIEGVMKKKKETVHIEHYFSYDGSLGYLSREVDISREKLRQAEENSPSLLSKLSQGFAASSMAVLQNPIEKFMNMVDRYFLGKAELEQEIFERSGASGAGFFNIHFSVITEGKDTWKPVRMLEYYPSPNTFRTLERWERVHEELPNYWYPAEEIERRDWSSAIAYLKENRGEMFYYHRELYEYIFSNTTYDLEFEEFIQKVKDETTEE